MQVYLFDWGDTISKDVIPAQKAGLNAIWFNPNRLKNEKRLKQIHALKELTKYEMV
ncbi:hypothetical protein [Shewanella nanhaiensis]|uniref:HAD family hydrolase n=1 Tax=Shewanella nanhaiensis TaxID=2864872 RepID=A0ABS7E3T6_9GAMM|nr:hypothetical protein [Shewanella nanhaiensis]MBW8184349.1 hypothetical protein [Shewanella nanhaiensis]